MPAKTFTDKRMLQFMDFVVHNQIKKVDSDRKFLQSIGYTNSNNIRLIRNGHQSFRLEHVLKTIQLYGPDANFFFVKNHHQIFNNKEKIKPLMVLKEAVSIVESHIESLTNTDNSGSNGPSNKKTLKR